MKYFSTLLLSVSLLTIYSCNNQQNKQPQKNPYNETQSKQDSINQVEQEKVIADINFGMTKNEVKNKIKNFINNSKKLDYNDGKIKLYNYFIGNYRFSNYGVKDYYYENKLYKLEIDGFLIEPRYFNSELTKQVNYIYDVISQKYDKASLNYQIPASYRMNEGYTYLIYQWDIGEKEIQIRIEKSDYGYNVNTIIFKADIEKFIKDKEQSKEKEKTKSAKDVF